MIRIHSHFLCFLLCTWLWGLMVSVSKAGLILDSWLEDLLMPTWLSSAPTSVLGEWEKAEQGWERGVLQARVGCTVSTVAGAAGNCSLVACGSEPRRAGFLITGVPLWVASSCFIQGPFQRTPIMTQLNQIQLYPPQQRQLCAISVRGKQISKHSALASDCLWRWA